MRKVYHLISDNHINYIFPPYHLFAHLARAFYFSSSNTEFAYVVVLFSHFPPPIFQTNVTQNWISRNIQIAHTVYQYIYKLITFFSFLFHHLRYLCGCGGCVIQLEAPEWKSISSNAKDLVLKMLAPNLHNRLTIEEVLNHPWMRVSYFVSI